MPALSDLLVRKPKLLKRLPLTAEDLVIPQMPDMVLHAYHWPQRGSRNLAVYIELRVRLQEQERKEWILGKQPGSTIETRLFTHRLVG